MFKDLKKSIMFKFNNARKIGNSMTIIINNNKVFTLFYCFVGIVISSSLENMMETKLQNFQWKLEVEIKEYFLILGHVNITVSTNKYNQYILSV